MRSKRVCLLFLVGWAVGLTLASAQQATTTPVVIVLTDLTGAGAAGAKIRIVPAPDPAPNMQTDNKGRLSLALKPGGYAIFASLHGFQKLARHFDVPASTEVQTVPFVLEIMPNGGPVMVSPASSKKDLAVFAYPYHEPTAFTLSELMSMPHITVTVHNPHSNADETYSGVRLSDLLTKLGAPLGKELRGESLSNFVLASGSDGYQALFALAEIDPSFHPGEIIVADTMNDKPLDAHSGPLKLVVTEDKRPARSVRNLTTIELKSAQ